MSLDPRSRERLAALGRTLPQKLPAPVSHPSGEAIAPGERSGRHRVETEQDPDVLFHELMRASPDGTVPPHLLDRLRQLELERRRPADAASAPSGAAREAAATAADPGSSRPRRAPGRSSAARSRGGLDPEQEALYASFRELLQDGDPDA